MGTSTGRALAAAGLLFLFAGVSAPEAGAGPGGKGRPLRGVERLAPPDGAEDADAKGRCRVRLFPELRARAERSWFRLQVKKLEPGTTYSLWADDPSTEGDTSPVEFDTLTTNEDGVANYRRDTKKDQILPFDAALADLGGLVLEVRNEAGDTTVLEGLIPVAK